MGSPTVVSVTLSGSVYTIHLSSADPNLANNAWCAANDGTNSLYGQIASGGGTAALTLNSAGLVASGTPASMAGGTPVTLVAPNMGLTVPLDNEPGTQWSAELQADIEAMDGHNHTTGNGAPLSLSGLNAVPLSSVGQPSGVASLDSGGHIPTSQIPSALLAGLSFEGGWNCSGGSYPSTPSTSQYWICTTAGTISGTSFALGDWLIYTGSAWLHIPLGAIVSSVNGLTGAVVLTAASVSAIPSSALVTTVGNPGSATSVPVESAVRSAISAAITAGQVINTVWSGSGAPAGTLGINGDFYVDYTNDLFYGPKSGGAWGAGTSIVGPAGASGGTGATGAQGPTGHGATTVTSATGSGATWTLNVADGTAFPNGAFCFASDGTRSIYGQVASGGGTNALAISPTGVIITGGLSGLVGGTTLTFAGRGNVAGSGSSTNGDFAAFNNGSATAVNDTGYSPASFMAAGTPVAQLRWVPLQLGTDYTATPASTSTLTMLTDQAANIQPGMALKFVSGGNTYYCQCTAITSTLLTVRGTSLGSSSITAVYYDSTRQVSQVNLNVEAAWTSTGASLAAGENHYASLDVNKAHLIGWRATLGVIDTGASQPHIEPDLNGSLVTNSVQMSATAGTWTDGGIWTGDVAVTFGQSLDVQCPTLGTNKTAAKLNLQMVFVQE